MAESSGSLNGGPLGPTVTPVNTNPGTPHDSDDLADQNTMGDDKVKDLVDPWENLDAHSAFLGPNLWDKRLPYDGQDFKLEYVDLEEFLNENGIPLGSTDQPGKKLFPFVPPNENKGVKLLNFSHIGLTTASPSSSSSSGRSSGGPGPPVASTSSALSSTSPAESHSSTSPFPPGVDPSPTGNLFGTHHGRPSSLSSRVHSSLSSAAAAGSSATSGGPLAHRGGPGGHHPSSPPRHRSLSPHKRGRCRSNSSSLDQDLNSVMSPGSSSGKSPN